MKGLSVAVIANMLCIFPLFQNEEFIANFKEKGKVCNLFYRTFLSKIHPVFLICLKFIIVGQE